MAQLAAICNCRADRLPSGVASEAVATAVATRETGAPGSSMRSRRPQRRWVMSDKPNVVLVHGGFVVGSGWQGVYDLLPAAGCSVSIVQNPTLSLEGDAAATRMILDRQDGPTILVGHSYGGAVISEAGTHERVAALVYVGAFAPDAGELVNPLMP